MQVRVITAAFALAGAFALAAAISTPASAYVGPKRDGNNCWKAASTQGIGHWEACPQENQTTRSTSGRSHSKPR